MDKKDLKTARIIRDHLEKFVILQFSDFNPPPLQQFLVIGKHQYETLNLPIYQIKSDSSIPKQIAQKWQVQSIIYIHSGAIELHKKQSRTFTRQIQYKENSFFSIVNYRNMSKLQPQFYRLQFRAKSIISIIPINQKYNYYWMKHIWQKKVILSKIFLYGQNEMQVIRKKNKFKQFMNSFQFEVYRRQTRIAVQGKINDKLYIISKGQAKLYKQLNLKNKNKGDINKNVEIVYLRQGSIIGGQIFLINNKQIHTIINNHAANQQQQINQTINEEQQPQEGEQFVEVNEQTQERIKKIKTLKKSVNVRDGGYQLYKPHDNMSNYTIVAQSANVEIFYIDLKKLVSIISQRYKINFIHLYSSFYITTLRRTHQKMILAMDIQKSKIQNQRNNIQLIAAKAYSSHQSRKLIQSQQSQGIIMRKSSLGLMTSNLKQLKSQEVWLNQNQNIQTKTNLLIKQKKPFVNYKQKIEALIQQKLNVYKNDNKEPQYDVISEDFCDIFMKNNEGRSEDIQKRNLFIEKKIKILQNRGGWKQGWNQLKPEGMLIEKKKNYQSLQNLNYLNGLKISQYTDKLKVTCSNKIHQTNKIKEQFMKIRSECPSCMCYENFQNFKTDRKAQTLTGFRKTALKTGEGWGRTSRVSMEQQSLQTVYNKMRFLSQRSKQKYNHNIHLLHLHRNKTKLERRRTAPKLS